MRAVSGFERPVVQWIYLALGVLLIAVAAVEAVGLRRSRAQIESLRVRQDQLENRLTHEQATRAALTLELGRLRGSTASTHASISGTEPTLTLTPLTKRGAQPPDATVAQPSAAQLIQLRLVLPRGRPAPSARYSVAVRTWAGGETVWQRRGLSASTVDGKPMVTAMVAGDVFSAGVYEVILSSSADPGAEVAAYEIGVRAADNPSR